MKNFSILCEGVTDQVLIGYYLTNVCGWEYVQEIDNPPLVNINALWYKKDATLLGIVAVNGNDFSNALHQLFTRESSEHSFDKILLIADHDDDMTLDNLVNMLNREIANFKGFSIAPGFEQSSVWHTLNSSNSFGNYTINVAITFVPKDNVGALETVVLTSLSENDEDKEIVVNQVKDFIDNRFQSSKYLKQRRDCVKAKLGISLSIFSPDRIFTTMNELLKSVKWSDYETIHNEYRILEEL